VGHSIQFADYTSTPLVKSVCANSASVAIGAQQISKKAIVDAYMGGSVMADGLLLCLVALLLWYLSIYVNCQNIAEFTNGILSIEKGASSDSWYATRKLCY